MNHQNLANLTTQYQQAYLAYCYKVMQYLQALAWLTEQQKAEKQANIEQVKPKSASGFKKLSQDWNQENLDFKPLKHKEKIKPNKNLAIESPYEAFGEVDYQLGTVENKYLFTGEKYDNNVGFYYLRARFYNPQNGRFVNMDTFAGMGFEPKTLHKYLYANGNPSNIIDPSGNFGIGQLMVAISVASILTSSSTSRQDNILYSIVLDANMFLKRGNTAIRTKLFAEFKNSLKLSYQLGESLEAKTYINFVGSGGIWDFKSRAEYANLPDIEAFGNFAFGASSIAWVDGSLGGYSVGIPDLLTNIIMRGAGYYQECCQGYDLNNGHWYDFAYPATSNYGDQFSDQANIQWGAEYYFNNVDTFGFIR